VAAFVKANARGDALRQRLALAAGLPLLLLATGCPKAPTSPTSRQVGELTVRFRPAPDPPVAGQACSFTVGVRDGAGPVSGAGLELTLSPTGSGQQAVQTVMGEEPGAAGRYAAHGVTLAVPGQWDADVRIIDARHGTITTKFRLEVVR
jgi:hypothetical protein